MRRALTAILAVGLLSGCSTASSWQQVPLAGTHPAALAPAGVRLLVGGSTNGAPTLLEVDADRVGRQFHLLANEPYASTAELVAVTATEATVYAIGTDIGGAHSNPRWTAWDGSGDSFELSSRPQGFFTFGGHDAGPLLGTAVLEGQPVIIGSRTTASGARLVLYTRVGTTWRAPATSPALLSSGADREFGFTGFTALNDRLVIVGDELDLSPGLHQQPLLWVGRPSGDWQQIRLPVPADLTGSGLSRATAVACLATADRCWVAGWVLGHPMSWQVDLPTGADPSVAQGVPLPGEAPDGADPAALVAVVAGHPVVATNSAQPGLQLGCPSGWVPLAAPGRVSALSVIGSGLYAISGDALWLLDAPGC